jgi:hypothetical protein
MEPELSADHLREYMLPVTWMLAALATAAASRAPVVVIAALRAGPGCFSTISAGNQIERDVATEIQARLESGALVPLEVVEPPAATQPRSEPRSEPAAAGRSQPSPILLPVEGFGLAPHQRRNFRLGDRQEAGDAWVGVWEADPPGTLPALVVEGYVECVAGDQLRTAPRSAALAMRNPWFAGEVADSAGAMMAVVNASAQAALADLCYSAGNLYFVPADMPDGRLVRLCSWSEQVAVPPFGSRTFPVAHEGARAFALHTRGNSVVLLLLRPVAPGVREYHVDSSIHFGSEVPPPHAGH